MRERWKTIPGWSKYEASTRGRIRRKAGYDAVGRYWPMHFVNAKGKRQAVRLNQLPRIGEYVVSQLVLRAFVGPPPRGKDQARHLDDVRANNKLSNLAWGSAWDNKQDAIRNGRTTLGTHHSKEWCFAISLGLRRFHKLKRRRRDHGQNTR